jgi:hypothetical protein
MDCGIHFQRNSLIDPDGFVIRKWNSKQLNNGIMTADFQARIS